MARPPLTRAKRNHSVYICGMDPESRRNRELYPFSSNKIKPPSTGIKRCCSVFGMFGTKELRLGASCGWFPGRGQTSGAPVSPKAPRGGVKAVGGAEDPRERLRGIVGGVTANLVPRISADVVSTR